jgi:hypothetical protein
MAKVGDYILKISHIGQAAHLLCWIYSKDFYNKLCWRYVGRSDANYNIKIDNNKRKVVDSNKEKEVLSTKDLKHINL